MSLRGRVLQRTPQSPACSSMSYQKQMAQYNWLARTLNIGQYYSKAWSSASSWALDILSDASFVKVKDVYSMWAGPSSARALRIPARTFCLLEVFWKNCGGTRVPASQRSGFLYKMRAGNGWKDRTDTWSYSGTIQPGTAAKLSLVASPECPMYTAAVAAEWAYHVGSWVVETAEVDEVYFVHPFFDITMLGNGETSNAVLIQQK